MPNPVMLFQDGDLRLSLEAHGNGIAREIVGGAGRPCLHPDEVEWAKALAERYAVEAPSLRVDEVWTDPPEAVQVDVSWDHFRRVIRDPSRPAYVPGHRTLVHIPFSGEKDVFKLRPSSYTLNPPHAWVADGELQLVGRV